MEGLLRAHRETVDELDPLDAEDLLQHALLHADIVGHREVRVAPAIERRRCVARRRGEAVAELVRDDDEVLGRIERLAFADRPFEIVMLRSVGGRVDDDVRPRRVERAVGLVSEARPAVGQPRLQHDIANLEALVIGHVSAAQPRSTWPAVAPVMAPRSQVTAPFTIVYSMPRDGITMRLAPPGRS